MAREQTSFHTASEAGEARRDVLEHLTSLVAKSLILAEEQSIPTRYRMLETVRQYAGGKLREQNETEDVRRRHCNYFLAFADRMNRNLIGSGQSKALAALDMEHDNLRQSLAFCQEGLASAQTSLKLGTALWRFWHIRGHFREGREWFALLLKVSEHIHARVVSSAEALLEYNRLRAEVLIRSGNLAAKQGDYAAARTLLEGGLNLGRELEDASLISLALLNLGVAAYDQGNWEAARSLWEEQVALDREMGNSALIIDSLMNLGNVAYMQKNFALARSRYEEGLQQAKEAGKKGHIAAILGNLGNVFGEEQDYISARTLLEQGLELRRELGAKHGIANSLMNLARNVYFQKESDSAHALYSEALAIAYEIGDKRFVAMCLEGQGFIALQQCQYLRAVRLLAAASALRTAVNITTTLFDDKHHELGMETLRAKLGDALDTAWTEGSSITWDQITTYRFDERNVPLTPSDGGIGR